MLVAVRKEAARLCSVCGVCRVSCIQLLVRRRECLEDSREHELACWDG